MKSLSDSLIDQVIEHETRENLKDEEHDNLDALTTSLAETTSLSSDDISAVVGNLQQETQVKKNSFQFTVPSISSQSLRIVVYLVLGLLAYSVYTAATVNGSDEPDHYLGSRNRTLDLYTSVTNVSDTLTSHYENYYQKNDRLPKRIKDLDWTYQTEAFLDSFAFIEDYSMSRDGTIRFELSEIYEANRWLELKPTVKTQQHGVKIEFDCLSNAHMFLLQFTGPAWCRKENF